MAGDRGRDQALTAFAKQRQATVDAIQHWAKATAVAAAGRVIGSS